MDTTNYIKQLIERNDTYAVDKYDEIDYLKKLLERYPGYPIDRVREFSNTDNYSIFEGTPRRHPQDDSILILFPDPFSRTREFYEFSLDSIVSMEDLGTISSETGENAQKARIWVKKGAPALKAETFIIE